MPVEQNDEWAANWGISPTYAAPTDPNEWSRNWGIKAPEDMAATYNIDQADQTARNRRIVDGVDPALANVSTWDTIKAQADDFMSLLPAPRPAAEVAQEGIEGAGGAIRSGFMGALKGANQLGALGADIVMAPYDLTMSAINPDQPNNPYKQIFPRFNSQPEAWEQTVEPVASKYLGIQDTPMNKVAEGLGEFVPSMFVGGGISKMVGAKGAAEGLGKLAAEKLPGILGKGAQRVANTTPDMISTYALMEGAKPEAERTPFAEWAAQWVAMDLGIGALGRLGKGRTQAPAELPDSDLIFGDTAKPDVVKPTPVLERMQGNYQGLNMPRTQAEKALPDNLLLNQMRNTFEGIPNREPTPLPRVPALNRNIDMATLPDKYPLPDVGNLEGKAWDRMTWQERNNRIQPPEELVTVNKINSAEKIGSSLPKNDPYNQLIAEEISRLKSEGNQGVMQPGLGFNADGEVVNRWGRASMNPKWYQDLYKANATEKAPGGRPPTAEQYRKLAIENLRNGTEHYDGTPIPANAEFLALERGMQTGKQMPEEWTNLEKIINVINENKEYSYSEKAQAIAQLRAEQNRILSQVEQPTALLQEAAGDNMGSRLNYKNENSEGNLSKANPFEIGALSDENGKVYIKNVNLISKSNMTKINNAIKKLGYDWRGEPDARQFLTNWQEKNIPLTGDQAEAVRKIFTSTPKEPQVASNYTKAIRKFGTTNDFREAGYLTPNGRLLDFSGKREGGPRGQRSMDHREINDIYDNVGDGYSDAMYQFIDEGNIRLQSYGFELAQQPTKQQEQVLSQLIRNLNGEVVVDLGKAGDHNWSPLSVEYPTGTKYTKIIQDIRQYYATGQEPVISDISRFRYKLSPAEQQDLAVLQAASQQRKIGPFTINKAELAPEALQRPEFQAAATIANKLGLRLVPYKGSGPRGIQYGRSIYLNEKLTDPVDYIFWHEVGHSMQDTHAEHYGRLMNIANEHLVDAGAIDKQYRGYREDKRPHEFAADVFAEALSTPGFFARMAEQSPELIKPLLEAIDRMIQQVKGMVSKDDTILPYLKNIEILRERVRQEVAQPYFKDAMGEKQFVETFGDQWQGAAKLKDENTGEPIQKYDSAKTSLSQVAGTFKSRYFEPGETNLDIGGGKYDKGTDYLAGKGVNNQVYDPFNRDATHNRPILEQLQGGQKHDSVTVNNVLNVIAEPEIRANVIKQAAKSTGDGKKAYFQIYEGSGQGIGAQTSKGWQNNMRAAEYMGEVGQFFNKVERKGNLIIASEPKGNLGKASWGVDNNPANNIRFKQERTQTDNLRDMVLAGARQIPKSGGFTQHFKDQMVAAYPNLNEAQLKFLYDRGVELRKGQTAFKSQGEVVTLGKKDLAGPTVAKNATTENWNHVTSKTTRGPIKARDITDKTYAAVFDNLDRLKQLDNLSSRVNNPSDRAYLLALNSREAGGTARTIAMDRMVDPQGNEIGQSLASITKQLPKGTADDFANYLVYRHAPTWLESGKQVFPKEEGITPEIARQRAAAYEQAHPEFRQIGDNLIQWQKNFKKAWLVDTGIIKPGEWDAMSQMYPDYVPLRRKMEDIEQGGLGGLKKGFANQSSPIKKATGSQREIINPTESIIEDTDRIVKLARRNEVMQAIDRNIRQDPEAFKNWIEILPEKGETFESAAAKDGIDGFINWLEEPFDQMVARKNIKYDKPNIVRSRVNGETVHYQVKDPALLNALTNLTPQGTNTVIEAARQVTRTMKILTTGSNPIFATRNMARDLPMAYIGSETLTKTPIAREAQFAWGIIDSFARIVTGGRYDPGSYYKTFKAMGGGSHSSAMASDRNLLAESKAKILPGYYDASKPLTTAGRGIKAIGRGVEAFTNAGETIPRLPEYVRTVKKGGDTAASRQQGLFNAQDVTVNFSKHGSVSKDADAVVPYLNAALQGIDKLGRIYTSNPAEAIQRSIIAVSVPTIWLWNINHDDPNYQKLSNYVKDNYFCLPMGNGKFVKIAKPRETGVVFSSLVERALRKWADDDPNGFKGFSEAWSKNFAPPYRWLGAPMTDIVSNKNFAGSPIVPGYMQRLSPEQQFDESTSAPAKALGKLTGSSPKKIDYLARSYTGVLGELGIPAAAEGRGESAGQRVKNVLGKTFTADPLYSNDIMTNFYDAKDRLDLANSDFKATKQKSPDYNPNKARIMNSAADKISDLNKQIRTVNSNKGMTYEAKDRRVRDLKQRSQNIAEQALARIGAVK